jgi:glutaredoxin
VEHQLVIYVRSRSCPFVSTALTVLRRYEVPYREVNIDDDPVAKDRLLSWVGFLSVPTLVVTMPGQEEPIHEPEALAKGQSPRGIDRGPMISEPGSQQLVEWLQKHGLLTVDRAVG